MRPLHRVLAGKLAWLLGWCIWRLVKVETAEKDARRPAPGPPAAPGLGMKTHLVVSVMGAPEQVEQFVGGKLPAAAYGHEVCGATLIAHDPESELHLRMMTVAFKQRMTRARG